MVLVVGSGGREHALVLALKASKSKPKIFAWPGNDGIYQDAERVPVEPGDFDKLAKWALENKISLVVIGPEVELVEGLADLLRANGLAVFGPSKDAAQLEGSKIFAKNFMREFGIPTANSEVVTSVRETIAAAQKYSKPYVLKADGLAAGKGVTISENLSELNAAAVELFENKKLGAAGNRALIEQFQKGKELSVLVLTNGLDYEVLPLCRDHKRLLDGDKGLNTGGMGVVSPVVVDEQLLDKIRIQILEPSIAGLQKRKMLFRGVLFIGIMLTPDGPQVLEYNVRFGDPETQAILPLLDGDWLETLRAVSQGSLPKLNWKNESIACLVLAAEGYPDRPIKGVKIEGDIKSTDRLQVLHAATQRSGENFVTNGGRVLNVVAREKKLEEAIQQAYLKLEKIKWPGMQYRKDIGS